MSPRVGRDACLGPPGTCGGRASHLGRVGMCGAEADECDSGGAPRRRYPHRDRHGGDRDPGLARMLLQLARLIARENRANQILFARRTTRRRYATASSAVDVQSLRTCSRSSWGSGAGGNRRENAAGRMAPQPWWAQVWHSPMCQTTRSRVCSVSCPSQSASNSPSAGQASRPVSAMCSAPRASSSRSLARVARSCVRLWDSPSTMARSLLLRSCLKLSSMTSRSRGFNPARTEWIRLRSSACPWSV